MQGTREDDDRDGVSPSPTGPHAAADDDLRAVYTKRRLSTEVLGRDDRNRGERAGAGFTLTITDESGACRVCVSERVSRFLVHEVEVVSPLENS